MDLVTNSNVGTTGLQFRASIVNDLFEQLKCDANDFKSRKHVICDVVITFCLEWRSSAPVISNGCML